MQIVRSAGFEAPAHERRMSKLGIILSILFVCCTALAQKPSRLAAGNSFSYGSCFARLAGTQLVVGNSHQQRTWRLDAGQLYATSLYDSDAQQEWIAAPSSLPSPAPSQPVSGTSVVLRGAADVFSPTEPKSLRVELEVVTPSSAVYYEFQIFPAAAGIRMWTEVKGTSASALRTEPATHDVQALGDALEHLQIANPHLRLIQVTLQDRTDQHNELVFEDEWLLHPNEALLQLRGNLFVLEDTLSGNGLIFLKEAPQPEMRPIQNPYDLWFSGSAMITPEKADVIPAAFYKLSFYGNGFTGSGKGYPHTLLSYRGGRFGRIAAIQQFQKQLRTYVPGRDGILLSNTWGDRSYEGKLNEEFIRREIDAGKALGVDAIEIDGGWQLGKTAGLAKPGGVWEGYWKADPHFWEPNPARFPAGFSSLSAYAHARGMKLGLWFAPDSSDDFANWEKDAAILLKWHREEGVDAFKLDSVKIRSKQGELNYRSLLQRVLSASAGTALLDLDVTAETRQGYFGAIAAGPLFVENRYTDMHRYWPHQTLRNLWKLSQWVDPVRLRMEFLNSERNTHLYLHDPLAPEHYRSDELFATVMFASPLAWFENTGLSSAYVADAAPLISRWKQERDAIHDGAILPLGSVPDGVAWTGFASVAQDKRKGYLLFFRELNASATWDEPSSPFAAGNYRIESLGGKGTVTQTAQGFRVNIPEPYGFIWVKLTPVSPPSH